MRTVHRSVTSPGPLDRSKLLGICVSVRVLVLGCCNVRFLLSAANRGRLTGVMCRKRMPIRDDFIIGQPKRRSESASFQRNFLSWALAKGVCGGGAVRCRVHGITSAVFRFVHSVTVCLKASAIPRSPRVCSHHHGAIRNVLKAAMFGHYYLRRCFYFVPLLIFQSRVHLLDHYRYFLNTASPSPNICGVSTLPALLVGRLSWSGNHHRRWLRDSLALNSTPPRRCCHFTL